LPEEYEKILKSSSDSGCTQLLLFTHIFYDKDMRLVLDFPTFAEKEVSASCKSADPLRI
jgi:hypothetical protein